jgi:hypothetical protein
MADEKKIEDEKIIDLDETIIEVIKPKNVNINYHGEWIVKYGQLCYGLVLRKKDNKVLITYNINPQDLHEDFFESIEQKDLPKSVYKLFQQKISKDMERLDTTMINLVNNKKVLNMFFSFAEEMKVDGSGEFPEA